MAAAGYPPERLPAAAATLVDHEDARSTTCSSHSEALDGGEQAELVVSAMVPIVRRAMLSSNGALFEASLDSMRQIERMFGQEALDHHAETLVAALVRQHGAETRRHARAVRVFETLMSLCSDEVAQRLRHHYPHYVGAGHSSPAASPQAGINTMD
eukprot:TRINITY_DN45296_c0_g1_i1.p2 TRINITY_DN45296_c0_g1~~TRINITY_DN45296_c0_g1_i1.p2  ORF type:complete len:156 (-),score=37.30 TRINITY_DN45296_c0_g1_i1:278-745(-)